jgi:hypothetical protein
MTEKASVVICGVAAALAIFAMVAVLANRSAPCVTVKGEVGINGNGSGGDGIYCGWGKPPLPAKAGQSR